MVDWIEGRSPAPLCTPGKFRNEMILGKVWRWPAPRWLERRRLGAWLKGKGNWIPGILTYITLHPETRESFWARWENDEGRERWVFSPPPPPPLLVPLSANAGPTAVLTVSVLTGWESPDCHPPPVGWGWWNHSAVSLLYISSFETPPCQELSAPRRNTQLNRLIHRGQPLQKSLSKMAR